MHPRESAFDTEKALEAAPISAKKITAENIEKKRS
jgi:hypothetical protein